MKYDDTVRVLGIEDIVEFVNYARDHALELGDKDEPDVGFACALHVENGIFASYDSSGVLVISCHECKRVIAQIEVAQHARTIPMRYKN